MLFGIIIKTFIALMFMEYEYEYEYLFPQKTKFPSFDARGKYDYSWRNKSSYFPHYHAINVYCHLWSDIEMHATFSLTLAYYKSRQADPTVCVSLFLFFFGGGGHYKSTTTIDIYKCRIWNTIWHIKTICNSFQWSVKWYLKVIISYAIKFFKILKISVFVLLFIRETLLLKDT